jgi:hypothetical protein
VPVTARGSGTGSPPIDIMIGRFAPTMNITTLCPLEDLRIEETGNHESAVCDLRILDKTLAYTAMRAEWRLHIDIRNPVSGSMEPMFDGFIREPRPEIKAIHGDVAVSAHDTGTLLDRLIIKVQGIKRKATDDASTKARIQWLFGQPDGHGGWTGLAVGAPMGFHDWSKVATMDTSPVAQTFKPNLTLRQALERILSAGSEARPDYFVDAVPRLWTFDDDTIASVMGTAPYDIDTTPSPGAGKVAPQGLEVSFDSEGLYVGYYVHAKTAAVSAFYVDSAPFASAGGPLASPYGIDLYGPRFGYFEAPDAATTKDVQRALKLALRDTRNPIPRITFSLEGTSTYDVSTGKRWQGGQRCYVRSPIHGLNGSDADAGPWAGSNGNAAQQLQPFRVVKVTTTFLSGKGDRQVEIELAGRRKHLYSGGA